VVQDGDDLRADAQRVFVDAVFEMRGQMTAEEWAEVFPGAEPEG